MEQIDKILNHDLFLECLSQIEEAEAERCFCLHNITHFLDVARIAQLINLTENYQIEKRIVYAAALLHDIGRAKQYKFGISHEAVGAQIADKILKDCGYDEKETDVIKCAILMHREKDGCKTPLGDILYRADKKSRPCYICKVKEQCYWSDEKKNLKIEW